MDEAQRDTQILDRIRQDEREFLDYLETVPQEWKGEAEYMHREGLALADIRDSIASYQETAEYPLRLTRWELDFLASRLQYASDLSPRERAVRDKMDRLGQEIDALRKERPRMET